MSRIRPLRNLPKALIAAFLLLGCTCAAAADDYVGRAFDFDLRVTVDGEPIRLHRRIKCYWKYHAREIRAFGEKTKTGGAVVVVTPRICNYPPLWKDDEPSAYGPMPLEGYVPMIALADDAADPKVVEFYVTQDAYDGPAPRIKIMSFNVQRIVWQKQMDQVDAFNNLVVEGGIPSPGSVGPPKKYSYMTAYTLQGIGDEVWSTYDESKQFRDFKEPQFLPRGVKIAKLSWEFSSESDIKQLMDGSGLRRRGSKDFLMFEGSESRERWQSLEYSIPLVREDNVFREDPSKKGRIFAYPLKRLEKPNFSCPQVEIGGTRIKCQKVRMTDYAYIFDSDKRVFYRIGVVLLYWPLLDK